MNDTRQILLVEQQPRLLRQMAFLLYVQGFEVLTASSGAEALEMLHSATPDVVVVDLKLPDMNGLDVLPAARAHCNHTPFIAISDCHSDDCLMQALERGVNDYLPKPFSFNDLMSAILYAMPAVPQRILQAVS